MSAQKGGSSLCGAPHGSLFCCRPPPPEPPVAHGSAPPPTAAAPAVAAAAVAAEAAGRAAAGLLAASAATTARGALHLGGRVPQGRADLVDVDLEDRATLALAGLVAAGLEAALHDDAHPLLQGLRDVL